MACAIKNGITRGPRALFHAILESLVISMHSQTESSGKVTTDMRRATRDLGGDDGVGGDGPHYRPPAVCTDDEVEL